MKRVKPQVVYIFRIVMLNHVLTPLQHCIHNDNILTFSHQKCNFKVILMTFDILILPPQWLDCNLLATTDFD